MRIISMSKACEVVSYMAVLCSAGPWTGDLTVPSAGFLKYVIITPLPLCFQFIIFLSFHAL